MQATGRKVQEDLIAIFWCIFQIMCNPAYMILWVTQQPQQLIQLFKTAL